MEKEVIRDYFIFFALRCGLDSKWVIIHVLKFFPFRISAIHFLLDAISASSKSENFSILKDARGVTHKHCFYGKATLDVFQLSGSLVTRITM